MLRQNSITTTNPVTMQKTNGFIEVVRIGILRGICDIVGHSIHHHSHIKINSREMTLSWIKDIRLNASAAQMVQRKIAILTATITELSRKSMPLQCLLSIEKLPALMDVVQARKRPILEFLLQLLELPEIQLRRGSCVRVHGAAVWLATGFANSICSAASLIIAEVEASTCCATSRSCGLMDNTWSISPGRIMPIRVCPESV